MWPFIAKYNSLSLGFLPKLGIFPAADMFCSERWHTEGISLSSIQFIRYVLEDFFQVMIYLSDSMATDSFHKENCRNGFLAF